MGGEFGQRREWQHDEQPRLARAASIRRMRGVQRLGARSQRVLPRRAGAARAAISTPAASSGSTRNDAENSVLAFLRKPRAGGDLMLVVCNFTPVRAHELPRRRAARRAAGASCSTAMRRATAAAGRATSAASTRRRVPAHGRYHSLSADAAAARRASCFKPRGGSERHAARQRRHERRARRRPRTRAVIEASRRRSMAAASRSSASSARRSRSKPTCFTDGHDAVALRAALPARDAEDAWQRVAMKPLGNDRLRAAIRGRRAGRYRYTVAAWVDRLPVLAPGASRAASKPTTSLRRCCRSAPS